jgi:hypothetical protein
MKRLLLCVGLAAVSAALVLGGGLAIRLASTVPPPPSSPFASVAQEGDAIAAKLLPGEHFMVFRSDSKVVHDITDSELLTISPGESVLLTSAHRTYHLACRISPSAAGLDVEAQSNVHDIKGPVKKFFIAAQ